ncbi:hypothetical protein [Streptomyces sp. NPDC020480]|uniref:hypothetical protein n=1 Tax=Streptomyces sp. NPDC020480 TaxID=3365076 RepID=UPI00378D9D8B
MRRRYQHLTSRVLKDTADKVGGLLRGTDQGAEGVAAGAGQSPVPAELMIHVARLGERRVPFIHREHADEVVAWWSQDWPDRTAEVEEWDRWRWESQGAGGVSAIRDRVPERAVIFHARALFLPGGERMATGFPGAVVGADMGVRDRCLYRPRFGLAHGPAPGTGQEVEAQVRGTGKAAVEVAFAEACAQAVDRAENPGKYGDTEEW